MFVYTHRNAVLVAEKQTRTGRNDGRQTLYNAGIPTGSLHRGAFASDAVSATWTTTKKNPKNNRTNDP